MSRVYNFSAGPSMLPLPVLEKAASEMTDYRGSGMSVMEMSHRTPVYEEIIHTAEANLRKLMSIPDNYKVLFLQGGATTQFSAVPLNLMNKNRKADYIVSGQFSKKAADEAARYGEVTVLASSKDRNFTYVPYVDSFSPDADYVHICHNNTIFGTTYNYVPATGDIPLVADMSSSIISCPVNVRDYALIYAGAQKNMGPSGLTVVIVREDLIGNARPETPVLLNYKTQADNESLLRHLHRRSGLRVGAVPRRTGGDGEAQPQKGRRPLRLSGQLGALQAHCGEGFPLDDERLLRHRRRGTG